MVKQFLKKYAITIFVIVSVISFIWIGTIYSTGEVYNIDCTGDGDYDITHEDKKLFGDINNHEFDDDDAYYACWGTTGNSLSVEDIDISYSVVD